jgi:hypothetical protein
MLIVPLIRYVEKGTSKTSSSPKPVMIVYHEKKHQHIPIEGHSTKYLTTVTKNKESLRNCHNQEELEKT